MKTKSIFISKTFWVNILLLVIAVVPGLMDMPELQLSKEWLGIIVLVANTIMRLITKTPAAIVGSEGDGGK